MASKLYAVIYSLPELDVCKPSSSILVDELANSGLVLEAPRRDTHHPLLEAIQAAFDSACSGLSELYERQLFLDYFPYQSSEINIIYHSVVIALLSTFPFILFVGTLRRKKKKHPKKPRAISRFRFAIRSKDRSGRK